MEPFIDFGLFELAAALGLAATARVIYSRRMLGILFLAASVALPIAVLFLVTGEVLRWLVAGCIATALVNGAVVVGAIQSGNVPTLRVPRRR